ncbi:MAG: triose-phosphate isomerase [Micavibrio sp.]
MKKLIAGNWKMNGDARSAGALMTEIEERIAAAPEITERCDFLVCPPFVYLPKVRDCASVAAVGGQDCSAHENGAYTGEIAAAMLKDAGASHVILGHSERRQYHAEADELVASKAQAAHKAGLTAMICVGETGAEREAGLQENIVGEQLMRSLPAAATAENTVIAYEPVWAIGTGKTATIDDIRAMHGFIRKKLMDSLADGAKVRILYGGSVKPDNAAGIFSVENVDGALIGGASLKTADFMGIAESVKGKD